MERQRVASFLQYSSSQSALNSASKKHDKDFSDEKSGELAQTIENLSNSKGENSRDQLKTFPESLTSVLFSRLPSSKVQF